MALNIRKVTAQRAENHQKNNKKDNFYIISIEIVFFIYLGTLCPRLINRNNNLESFNFIIIFK